MSLRSFWHKPIYEPQPPKKKIGCLGWCGILAGLFIVAGIAEGFERIKNSAHPTLYFTLAGIAVVALLVGIFYLLHLLLRDPSKKEDAIEKKSHKKARKSSETAYSDKQAEPNVNTTPISAPASIKNTVSYEFYRVKVVDVTLDNEDGTSRQELIKKMYYKEPPFDDREFPLELEPYECQGEPTFKVLFNGYQIGNLSKKDSKYLNDNMNRYVTLCGAKIVGGDTPKEDDFFKDDFDDGYYSENDFYSEPVPPEWGFHFNVKLTK